MSLSDQIKQPGQIIGSGGGGGGGTTDAGDLTTGTLAAARLPGVLANVDTQAELLSAAAAAAASHTHAASDIASGTVATARLGSGTADNTTFLRGDSTWAAPSDATKLPLAGGTMTGAVSFSGSISSAGSTVRNIHGNGGTTDLYANVPTGGNFTFSENGDNNIRVSANGIVFAGANSISASAPCIGRRNTSDIFVNTPTGYVLDCNVNAVSQATIGTGGLQFPTAHSAPAGTVFGVYRGSDPGISVQAGTTGYAYLGAAASNAQPVIAVCGVSSGHPGAIGTHPAAVSLAASGTRTVVSSATTRSGDVTIMNTTDGKRATFSVENGTPVKIEGDASFVAGAPGASQIGLELSSTTLRINNGYAGAKLIAFIARLA